MQISQIMGFETTCFILISKLSCFDWVRLTRICLHCSLDNTNNGMGWGLLCKGLYEKVVTVPMILNYLIIRELHQSDWGGFMV